MEKPLPPDFAYGVTRQLPSQDRLDEIAAEVRVNGFSVLDGGFDPDFLLRLRKAVDQVYQAQVDEMGGDDALTKIHDADVARGPLAYDPIFLEVAASAPLLALSRRLLGSEIMLSMQNAIINRHDRKNHQIQWHRDLPYQHWVSSEMLALNALFCVDEFTALNGATFVLPATHHVEPFPTLDFCAKFERQVVAPAGSFLILDAMLFHRAGINRSQDLRRAVNHVITRPFFSQQIDIPKLFKSRGLSAPEDPALQKYLGYSWAPAESAVAWRKRRNP